jgi:hypothetical protein
MAETEIVAHLRFAPESLDLLRKFREDLIIVHHALGESPEGKAAFERFITSLAGSFEKLLEIFQEAPGLGETVIGEFDSGAAKAGD